MVKLQWAWFGILGLAAAGALAGCTQTDDAKVTGVGITNHIATRDPAKLLIILGDTTAPKEARQEADRRFVEQKGPADAKRLATLERMLFERGHSEAMQIYAMDQIVAADRARAVRSLASYLPKLPEGPVLDHACALCVELKDEQLLGALIKSLGREQRGEALEGRAEAKAIEKLTGRPLERGLVREFQTGMDIPTRLAALGMLRQIQGDDSTKMIALVVADQRVEDEFEKDVKWGVAMFGMLPANRTEVDWLHELQEKKHEALVRAAKQRHELLKNELDYVFALRFVPVLARTDDAAIKMNRQQLMEDLQSRLSRLEHVKREPLYQKAADDLDESLEAHPMKLTRGDLLAMRLILHDLEHGTMVATAMQQGLADRADTTTEHGGLLLIDAHGTLALQPYPAIIKNSDFQYTGSDELTRDLPGALAQYHYHFQKPFNDAIAGPGVGDLSYAKNARCSGVVFTSVKGDRVDVDYFTPEGAVVDLGVWSPQNR